MASSPTTRPDLIDVAIGAEASANLQSLIGEDRQVDRDRMAVEDAGRRMAEFKLQPVVFARPGDGDRAMRRRHDTARMVQARRK